MNQETESHGRRGIPDGADSHSPGNDGARDGGGQERSLSFFQIVGSTLAAAFGVQSSRNRERDFSRGRISHFIVAGIIFTVVFVLAVIFVVRMVLSSAGA